MVSPPEFTDLLYQYDSSSFISGMQENSIFHEVETGPGGLVVLSTETLGL